MDKAAISDAIKENPPYAQDVQYHICGPGNMNQSIRESLMSFDVPPSRIHVKSYDGYVGKVTSNVGLTAAKANIILQGHKFSIDIARGQTLLEVPKSAKLKPLYSCQSGVCGACRAKLTKGEVNMHTRMAINASEIEQGIILTCQSLAKTETLTLSYD